ncbi:AAA family ATPase [Yersinia sp. 2544 StPb PI]
MAKKTKEEIETIESEKTINSERVECQKSTVNIDEAIVNINQGLTDIGITDFYIEKHEGELYRLVRTDSHIKIFSSLSEGEKMIISLLYFRELFRGKQSATEGNVKKIAVIDDPVSSLSHIFVYNIGQLLKNDFSTQKTLSKYSYYLTAYTFSMSLQMQIMIEGKRTKIYSVFLKI